MRVRFGVVCSFARYVSGGVHHLCPLDEATITMRPPVGPVAGGTLIELRASVQVRNLLECLLAAPWLSLTLVEL